MKLLIIILIILLFLSCTYNYKRTNNFYNAPSGENLPCPNDSPSCSSSPAPAPGLFLENINQSISNINTSNLSNEHKDQLIQILKEFLSKLNPQQIFDFVEDIIYNLKHRI